MALFAFLKGKKTIFWHYVVCDCLRNALPRAPAIHVYRKISWPAQVGGWRYRELLCQEFSVECFQCLISSASAHAAARARRMQTARYVLKVEFHGSHFLVASSPTRPTSPRGCYEDVAHVGVVVQLATRLPDWSAGGLLPVCRSHFQKSKSTTCYGHSHEDPCSILVRHVRHTRFRRDLLATSSWGCYEDNCCHGI